MKKKNRLMAILTIGALLLVIGSSAIRCTLANTTESQPAETTHATQDHVPETEAGVGYPVTLIGTTDELYSTFGKTQADFAQAVNDFAQIKYPTASVAVWDCQVWIDFTAGTYLTNFTLNDDAMTIITVKLNSTGKLSIL